MEVTYLPVNSDLRYKSMFGLLLATLSNLFKIETTIILSENFRSLFNLVKLEETPNKPFLQALVFAPQNPPVFLAFVPLDHLKPTAKRSCSRDKIKTYVAKLVRSLTSSIHTFSDESIAIATVIIDPDDMSNLKEKIAEATVRLPASRRGMTAALCDHLTVAVTASLGLGASMAGSTDNDLEKLDLVNDLKCNKGRMRRLFSALGDIIWHLEDVQSPRISSSLTSCSLVQTLDLNKPTLVVCSDRSRKSLEDVSRKFKWDIVTRSTAETTSQTYANVLEVDLDDNERNGFANRCNAATTVVRIYDRVKVTPPSESAPPLSAGLHRPPVPSGASHQQLNSGSSGAPVEPKQKRHPAIGRRRSSRIQDSLAKRPKLRDQQNITSNEDSNASRFSKVLRPMTIHTQAQPTSTVRPDHPIKSTFVRSSSTRPPLKCYSPSTSA